MDLEEPPIKIVSSLCDNGAALVCRTDMQNKVEQLFAQTDGICRNVANLVQHVKQFRACVNRNLEGCPKELKDPLMQTYHDDAQSYNGLIKHCHNGTWTANNENGTVPVANTLATESSIQSTTWTTLFHETTDTVTSAIDEVTTRQTPIHEDFWKTYLAIVIPLFVLILVIIWLTVWFYRRRKNNLGKPVCLRYRKNVSVEEDIEKAETEI